MANNVCKSCGANLVYRNGRWVCPACGLFKEEELSNEEVTLLYNAEQKLRLASFDEAEDLYKDIIKKYPENAQGYWGLLLAKYGIKYEVDYDGTQKPTCYAVTIESVQSDPNYQKVLDQCKDKEEKRSYIEKAKEIEKIRVEWLEKAIKEPQYDIFICFKDTDKERGFERTDDSWDVADLYVHLSQLGYKVFYSRESLRDKASEKWEPYIYQAINTASIMLVYGRTAEYFETTWMKNEWTRYFRRMREGKKVENSLLVAYAGQDPENLPKPFNSMQVMDARRKSFYGDLEKQIAKIIAIVRKPKITVEKIAIKGEVGKKKTEVEGKQIEIREIGQYDVPVLTPSDATKLKTAQKMLGSGLFEQALKAINEVINKNPQNGQALLLQYLAEHNVADIENLPPIEEAELNQIEKIIEYVDKTTGEKILRKVANAIDFSKGDQEIMVAFVLQYNFTERDTFINKWVNELTTHDNNIRGDKIFSEILNYIDKKDIDTHIALRFRYAETLRKNGAFADGKRYYEEVLSIDESHLGARWGVLCCEIGYSEKEPLSQSVVALQSFESLENLFRYCTPASKQAYLDKLLSAVNEATKRDVNAIKIFDRLIQYYTEEENAVLLKKVFDYAKLCQEIGAFDSAEKYYALAISLDDHNQDAYWGLMQVKLKCRTNDDLIKQPVPISEMTEFSSAIAAAGEDDRSTDRYIALAKAQMDYQKEQEAKRKKQKKIKKRISIVAAAIVLVIAIIITTVSVVSVEKKKASLNYLSIDSGYSVVAGEKYKQSVTRIPATYNGSNVTEIADNAFADNTYIEKVVIPATVTKIGKNAFAGCTSLEEVVFAANDMVAYADSGAKVDTYSNVTFVGENAFDGCRKLRKIDLRNAENIEKSAFRGCESLTTVELSEQLHTLKQGTFQGCRSLRSIDLPENLVSVEDGCFAGCETLQEISIPATVTNLGAGIFQGCTELKTIALDSETAFDDTWAEGLGNTKIGVTVYLDYNGATGNIGNSKVVLSTGEYFTLPRPTKEGYTFIGWFTHRIGGAKVTTAESTSLTTFSSTSKTTYYARFIPNVNTIVFDKNGGSGIMQVQSADTDSTVTLKTNEFVKDGYTFAGWGTTKYSVDYSDGASYRMGTAPSYTLYAIWTANQNVLAFDANGGEGTMENMLVYTDATATLSENQFSKKGYRFIGWGKTATGNVEYNDKASYTMGTLPSYTLYATWEIETYTITYELNGGTANNKTSYTILTDTFSIENPDRTGYDFTGWTGTDLSDTTMTLSVVKGSTGNKTFTANWLGHQNTLSFNANGGEGEMNDSIVRSGESIVLPQNTFTRRGYDFAGWSTTANGEPVYIDKATYEMGISPENTLYAVWNIITYTLTYDLDKGSVANANKTNYTVQTNSFTLNNPERPGYEFLGWTGTGLDSVTKTVSVENGSVGNRTYTANWQANLNTLSFHANGGEGEMSDMFIHTDEKAQLTQNQFTRKGYSFVGWSITTGGSVVYADKAEYTMDASETYDLYAQWQINTYTISYTLNGGTVASNKTSYTVETSTFTLNNPGWEGYEFIGWTGTNLDEETLTVTIEKGSTGDRTYTANWQGNLNTLTFIANSGTGEMADMQIRTAQMAKLSPCLFSKTGYTFSGWSRTSTGAVAYADEADYTMGTSSSYRLYAKWTPNQNTIVFYGNGSTYGAMESILVNTDATISLPACSFEKEGYSFIGWATSANGEVIYEDKAEYLMGTDSSYSLYARWEINQYTITIEPNGGTANKASITQDYNTVVAAPTISRQGYNFVDWYEDAEFTTVYNFATMQAKDVTAYAKWQIKTSGDELTGIRTPQELQDINTHLDGNFYLENDIDMTNIEFVPIGSDYFTGVFDGNDKEISNLHITGSYIFAGLFAKNNGMIKRVHIVSAQYNITAQSTGGTIGGIVGSLYLYGTVQDSTWEGSLTVTNGDTYTTIGGIAGSGSGTVERCMTSGSIKTGFDAYIGGISGLGGTVKNCLANIRLDTGKHTWSDNPQSSLICSSIRVNYATQGSIIINSLAGENAYNWYTWESTDGTAKRYNLSDANSTIRKSYQVGSSDEKYYLSKENANSRIYMTQTAGWDEAVWCFGYGYPVLYGREYIRVIYNNVDGLNNDANPSGFKIGSDGFTLASVTKTGYTFGGWYLNNEYTQSITKIENLTEITNIYAKWTANTYTVTLNPVSGTLSDTQTKQITFDSSYTLPVPTPYIGYDFIGWYDGTGNTAVAYTNTNGNSIQNWNVATDKMLYAKYDKKEEMRNMVYNSTSQTCNITDIIDKTVTDIVIPNYVTSISKGALSNCSQLETISLPFIGKDNNESIWGGEEYLLGYVFGEEAYEDAEPVEQDTYKSGCFTYYIPTSLRNVCFTGSIIPAYAFYNCQFITTVTLGEQVQSVGRWAFLYCYSLQKVNYLSNIDSWCGIIFDSFGASNPLYYAHNLYINNTLVTELVIPDTVKTINFCQFEGGRFSNIIIGNQVTQIWQYAFNRCLGVLDLIIPDSVESISRFAFASSSLTSITIGSGVKQIEEYAFNGCYRLVEIYNKSTLQITLDDSNYGQIAAHAKAVYTNDFESKITQDSDGFVYYNNELEKILIEYIGSESEVIIPSEISRINTGAFYQIEGITNIEISNSIVIIDNYAFHNCNDLTQIIIPTTVTSINQRAFFGCENLVDISYQGTKSQWLEITKGNDWDAYTGNYVIHCTNGDINK